MAPIYTIAALLFIVWFSVSHFSLTVLIFAFRELDQTGSLSLTDCKQGIVAELLQDV